MPGLCHLVLGPMFAKKTTRVIMYKRRLDKKGTKTLIFKHFSDMRYDNGTQVTSHDQDSEHCIPIHNTAEIFTNEEYKSSSVIIIEEAQFFEKELVEDCRRIVNEDGKYLIVSALSGDYKMRPFGHVHELICIANSVEMATSCCEYCEEVVDANYTLKISGNNNQIEVGVDKYVPVCRKHHLLHSNYALYKEQQCNSNIINIKYNAKVNTVQLINFPTKNQYTINNISIPFRKLIDVYIATIPDTWTEIFLISVIELIGTVTYYVDDNVLYCIYKSNF